MLTLFGRPGCHLCIESAALLDSLKLAYLGVDIDDDLALSARYGLLIPVVQRKDGATLNFPFDAQALLAFQYGSNESKSHTEQNNNG